ncbi:MAG: type I-C CRISPR-associated protein Cas5c, partial [Chthonomonadaceae bacterium]|nr:type I-C CRISPR-associated protein Cas5c [Chthonomonadaceae bacterium]
MDHSLLEVEVWADFACFTRPEFKVERVSYPMMTPSAARGVLESIFWKPEFSWQVRAIHVLRPRHSSAGNNVDALSFYRHFSILRNEVSKRATGNPIFVDDTDTRAQRHTLGLRDVAYLIQADIVLRPHATDDIAKYRDQFRRRVARGQCFSRPYLGCREFACDFAPPDGTVAMRRLRHEQPIRLGTMLFDVIRREKG